MTSTREPPITWTLAQVKQLSDFEEQTNVICPIIVTKEFDGNKKYFQIDVNDTGENLKGEVKSVPLRTQPTLGFQNNETEPWSTIYDNLIVNYHATVFFLNEAYYNIMALGAMATYFPEVFHTYPYFDFLAAEVNCGKSTAMKALILSSRYGKVVGSTTAPSLYRDRFRCTIGIDELDNQLQDKDARPLLLSVLNSGYVKGFPSERVNTDFEVEYFDAFGPKAFSRIKGIPESIISRSITFNMHRSPKNLEDLEDTDPFVEIRDALYKRMLYDRQEVQDAYQTERDNSTLTNREKQLFSPLLTMARLVSNTVYRDTLAFAYEFVEQRAGTYDDPVIKALIEVLLRPEYLGQVVPTKNICQDLHILLVERGIFSEDSKPHRSRTMNHILDSLDLKRAQKFTDGYTHYTIDNNKVMNWAIEVYKLIEPKQETLILEESSTLSHLSHLSHSQEDDTLE